MTLKDRILNLISEHPGLSDREITNKLLGEAALQQPVNGACRALEASGLISRDKIPGGRIGNYVKDTCAVPAEPVLAPVAVATLVDELTEDRLKTALKRWLESDGWTVQVAMGHVPGIDVDAFRDSSRWIIEVKGCGSLNPMRVNYFLCVLGETLQRMSDPAAKYSIALPDMQQYRRLWERLPILAKQRTAISVLFVANDGTVVEVS
ncbi:MAG: hypothetical protein P4L33_02720 [Capsulimonadaceae bacterium]|nr:hypothetical protein [Capsulimonadaceae bacterium]